MQGGKSPLVCGIDACVVFDEESSNIHVLHKGRGEDEEEGIGVDDQPRDEERGGEKRRWCEGK